MRHLSVDERIAHIAYHIVTASGSNLHVRIPENGSSRDVAEARQATNDQNTKMAVKLIKTLIRDEVEDVLYQAVPKYNYDVDGYATMTLSEAAEVQKALDQINELGAKIVQARYDN